MNNIENNSVNINNSINHVNTHDTRKHITVNDNANSHFGSITDINMNDVSLKTEGHTRTNSNSCHSEHNNSIRNLVDNGTNQSNIYRLIFNQNQACFTNLDSYPKLVPQHISSNPLYLISDNTINVNAHNISIPSNIDGNLHQAIRQRSNTVMPQLVLSEHQPYDTLSQNPLNINSNYNPVSYHNNMSKRSSLTIATTNAKIMSILPKLPKQLTNDNNIKLKLNSEAMNFLFNSDKSKNTHKSKLSKIKRSNSTGNFTNNLHAKSKNKNKFDNNNNRRSSTYSLKPLHQSNFDNKSSHLERPLVKMNDLMNSINITSGYSSSDKKLDSNSPGNYDKSTSNNTNLDDRKSHTRDNKNNLKDNTDDFEVNNKPVRKKRKYTRRKPTLSEIEEANVQKYLNSMGYRPMVMVGSNESNEFLKDPMVLDKASNNSINNNNPHNNNNTNGTSTPNYENNNKTNKTNNDETTNKNTRKTNNSNKGDHSNNTAVDDITTTIKTSNSPISTPNTTYSINCSNSKNSIKRDEDNESGIRRNYKDKLNLNDRRKFFCRICDKGFTTSGHLARHHRIHTGEKNHPCSFPGCFQRFSRQDNCLQHYRTHFKSRN